MRLPASLVFTLLLAPLSVAHAQSSLVPEVVASASAEAGVAGEIKVLVAELQQRGAKGTEAAKAAETALAALKKATSAADASAEFFVRGERMTNAADPVAAISSGTAVAYRQEIEIRTKDAKKVGLLIDALLAAGASTVTPAPDISSIPGASRAEAIKRATLEAKHKAQYMAEALGATLGPAISISVDEEPVGAQVRRMLQTGNQSELFGGHSVQVQVTVRFQLKETPR